MPDEYKFDTSIDTLLYKMYIASKPWVASNYLRDESKNQIEHVYDPQVNDYVKWNGHEGWVYYREMSTYY